MLRNVAGEQPIRRTKTVLERKFSVRNARAIMTSDSVSVSSGHNSLTPSDPFTDRLERVVAEADIRNLSAQFSDAVNYNDPAAFSALWSANSVWEIGEPYVSRANGRA